MCVCACWAAWMYQHVAYICVGYFSLFILCHESAQLVEHWAQSCVVVYIYIYLSLLSSSTSLWSLCCCCLLLFMILFAIFVSVQNNNKSNNRKEKNNNKHMLYRASRKKENNADFSRDHFQLVLWERGKVLFYSVRLNTYHFVGLSVISQSVQKPPEACGSVRFFYLFILLCRRNRSYRYQTSVKNQKEKKHVREREEKKEKEQETILT